MIEDRKVYQMIADVDELKWFFDHVMTRPRPNESYSAVFVSRHKKLTKEEQKVVGLTRRESEFLATQTFRSGYDMENKCETWTFESFLKCLKRFNVDAGAYTTALGEPIPDKTLAVIFYVNPCDDMAVVDSIMKQADDVKTGISKAMLGGKELADNVESFRFFGNFENSVKHLKAHCKGATYWMDFDLDVPAWFKEDHTYTVTGDDGNEESVDVSYYRLLKELLDNYFGRGAYVIVDTSGGYHILVRTVAIRGNPNDFCLAAKELYETGVAFGEDEYIDENGNVKFECVITASNRKFDPEQDEEAKAAVEKLEALVESGSISQREFKVIRRGLYDSLKVQKEKSNKSSIPGIPLPGTYQYNRPVTVLNKEDFE